MPKNTPYRNQKLRDLAKDCPHCMMCRKPNDGTIVGAHSNSIEDGHGTGQKAHDCVAYLCSVCHHWVDTNWGRGGSDAFYQAVYRTIVWLLKERHLVTK